MFLISAVACKKENDNVPDFKLDHADQLTTDEYEVYGVILENFSMSQLVIKQQTSVQTPSKESFKLFFNLDKTSGMETTLYSKYVEENFNSYLLDERIMVPTKSVKMISNKEYEYYFEREDLYKAWTLFENQYPNSGKWFFSLNKIGFNDNKTQAIVGIESYWFMESPDGPTLSLGTLFYLEKKNQVWVNMGSTTYSL